MTRRYPALWTVRWKRRGWTQAQARHYFIRSAAGRLLRKLQAPAPPGLAPVVELSLERRELGPVEKVWKR